METHKRILGVLYLVWGVFSLLLIFVIGIALSFALYQSRPGDLSTPELSFVHALVTVITGFIILVIALPAIIGGVGMLYNKKWAFILILIVGIFSLLSFPMGTAIGIYTLWAYFREQEISRGGPKETYEKRSN